MARIMNNILKIAICIVMVGLVSCTKWNYDDGGVSNGVHDCSMWEYLHTQSRDWDSTIVMIERAGLRELFEGKGEHEQITFLGLTNYSIRTYLLDMGYKQVNSLYWDECYAILSKLIITERVMVADVPRGTWDSQTGEVTGGKEYSLLDGTTVILWTTQEPYMDMNTSDVGIVRLNFKLEETNVSRALIFSSDIQTNNGVVQALGYDFNVSDIY
ncbi:hypothetical protein [Butyricimonas sp. Marseille-P3923]|uniref:hypothetical protein n=1 Tax=Butyricimonas sp. Marseille-P3923 TaxID=1987504 RepID=UPI0021006684|nr:hypothetical protein [Butyricimonas sp. Marseille-P3923]